MSLPPWKKCLYEGLSVLEITILPNVCIIIYLLSLSVFCVCVCMFVCVELERKLRIRADREHLVQKNILPGELLLLYMYVCIHRCTCMYVYTDVHVCVYNVPETET